MRTVTKIFSKFIQIITIFILIVVAFFFVQKAIWHYAPYVVLSGSMEPGIPTGAMALINQKDIDVEVGDIIMYEIDNAAVIETGGQDGTKVQEGTLVTHRVIEQNDDGTYVVKGDANENADAAPVTKGQIRGTFVYSIPYIGYVYAKLGTKGLIYMAIALVVLNIAAILFEYSFSDKKEKKEETTHDTVDV